MLIEELVAMIGNSIYASVMTLRRMNARITEKQSFQVYFDMGRFSLVIAKNLCGEIGCKCSRVS